MKEIPKELSDKYTAEELEYGKKPKPWNYPEMDRALKAFYKATDNPEPGIIHVKDPDEAIKVADELLTKAGNPATRDEIISHMISDFNPNWLLIYRLLEWRGDVLEPAISAMSDILRWCGPWIPLDEVVIVSDPPSIISFNEALRLHAEGGQSYGYSTGLGLHYLNGIYVEPEVAELPPDQLSGQLLVKYTNQEVRREILRRIDPMRLIDTLDAEVIHEAKDELGNPMQLVRLKENVDVEPVVLLIVTDPAGAGIEKKAVLRVPPDMKDCLEAQLSTFKITLDHQIIKHT